MAEATSQKVESARRRTVGIGPWAFCLLSPVICLLPVGCAPDDFSSAGDPLIGGPPVRSPSVAAASAGRGTGAVVVPPLPPSSASGTTGALASAPRGTLDPGSDELRIRAPEGGAVTWQGSGGSAAGVVLQPPQPIAAPTAPVQLASNVTVQTYDQLKAQLRARGVGVISFKTDLASGETTLTCFVPIKGDPSKQQVHTTKAADEVSAMRAVLDQLDRTR
jgi:hypothetical protein